MVEGIERFRDSMAAYADNYIIIGGTACDIVLDGSPMRARPTRDIDLIVVVEKLSREFVEAFWKFVRDGGYEPAKRTSVCGEQVYALYRFAAPKQTDYPYMLELLSRHSELLGEPSGFHIEPIPDDEEHQSLSAIIMNDEIYQFTLAHSILRGGLRVADTLALVVLKATAYFSEDEIMYAARTQLTWTHLRSLMAIDDPLERQFYMEMCRLEHWDTRTLDNKIDSQLYQRTALSRRSEEVVRQELAEVREGTLNPDMVFRSTYFLDMLGLPDVFSEKELEDSIISNLLQFIKELGSDFTFVDRQKRITVDSEDYFLDLLFFHRGLRRLVAIDLKLGKFKPAYEGQMRLYLRYLNANDRKEWEDEPIGLILCSEGNTEHIHYLMMDEQSDIRVAQYYTQLPDKEVLADRLQRAIAIAREHQIEAKPLTPNL